MNDSDYQADTYVMTPMPGPVPTVAEARGTWVLSHYAAGVLNARPAARVSMTRDYLAYGRWYAAWLWWFARDYVRELWRELPGPVWVRVLIMAILVAGLLMPGQLDDMALLAMLRLLLWATRKIRARGQA